MIRIDERRAPARRPALEVGAGGRIWTGSIDGQAAYTNGQCLIVGTLPRALRARSDPGPGYNLGARMEQARPERPTPVTPMAWTPRAARNIPALVWFDNGTAIDAGFFDAIGGTGCEWRLGNSANGRSTFEARANARVAGLAGRFETEVPAGVRELTTAREDTCPAEETRPRENAPRVRGGAPCDSANGARGSTEAERTGPNGSSSADGATASADKAMKEPSPIADDEIAQVIAEVTEAMAVRCRLKPAEYERRVLLPAILAAEKAGGLDASVPELHRRTMRAAGTSGFRTPKGLKRWIENATWRWRRSALRRVAAARRAAREPLPELEAGTRNTHGAEAEEQKKAAEAEREARWAREREALERAADEREAARLAGIKARRVQVRQTVLGAEAAARADGGEAATIEWTAGRWTELEKYTQEACWTILRPLLGLEPGTYGELMERRRRTEAEIRAGRRPRPDQTLLRRRKRWREARIRAWTRIGEAIRKEAAGGLETAAEWIGRQVVPRRPLP